MEFACWEGKRKKCSSFLVGKEENLDWESFLANGRKQRSQSRLLAVVVGLMLGSLTLILSAT